MLKLILVSFITILSSGFITSPANATGVEPETEECYRGEKLGSFKAAAQNTIGTTTLIGLWCFVGKTVTQAELLDGWAETSTPFWSVDYSQSDDKDSGIVDNEARIWQRFHFHLLVGTTWLNFTQTEIGCSRIIGRSSGDLIETDTRCSIY